MPLNLLNIDYSGVNTNILFQQAFEESSLRQDFGCRVVQAVKSKYVFHALGGNINLQAYDVCPESGTGIADLVQISKELCEFMMTAEFDNNVLLGTYYESEYGRGSRGDKVDATQLMQFIIDGFINKAAEQLDDIAINGDATYGSGHLGLCDGLIQQWLNTPNNGAETVTGTNITASNVQAELDKLWNAVNPKLKYRRATDKVLKIAAAKNIIDAWMQYLTTNAAGYPNFDPSQPGVLRYKGVELVPLGNLNDNEMFATYPDNLAMVFDDDTDFQRFNVTDLSATNALCDKTTVKMTAKVGFFYGIGEDITFYSPDV